MLNASKWLMISACAMCAGPAAAQAPSKAGTPSYPALAYPTTSRAPVIPPNETGLQTIVAEPWYSMTTDMPAFGGMEEKAARTVEEVSGAA